MSEPLQRKIDLSDFPDGTPIARELAEALNNAPNLQEALVSVCTAIIHVEAQIEGTRMAILELARRKQI